MSNSNKRYRIILADPPWSYQNWTDAKNGAAASAYPVLKDRDIINLPIQDIAEDDCMLFLWATWPKIEIALASMKNWGFQYVTAPVVWNKTNADGSPYHGIGFWAVGGSEFILMGRRGKGISRNPETRGKIKQVITMPRGKHSAKPPSARDQILGLVGDHSRIELFARDLIPGWDATGLELDGMDIRTFLDQYKKEEVKQ